MNQQRDLFDTRPPPWELDDATDGCVATVVFAEGLDGEFDYLVPDKFRARSGLFGALRLSFGS